jgi:hypothetical protein
MIEKDTQKQTSTPAKPAAKKPNETGSIRVEGFVKIFDPKSQEIFVEKRA